MYGCVGIFHPAHVSILERGQPTIAQFHSGTFTEDVPLNDQFVQVVSDLAELGALELALHRWVRDLGRVECCVVSMLLEPLDEDLEDVERQVARLAVVV